MKEYGQIIKNRKTIYAHRSDPNFSNEDNNI